MRRTCTSPRWKKFDYTSDNLYFITTVVKNRIPCFGDLQNGKMILNEFGKIVEGQWLLLAENFPYVKLREFVIMPDHFHGIIEINRTKGKDQCCAKIKPLYDLVGAFKMTSSKKIHESGFESFIWQRSFHDRVIRNEYEYFSIAKYIEQNPEVACRNISESSESFPSFP